MTESHLPGILAGLGIVGLLVGLLLAVFWVWLLIDCLINPRLTGTPKVIWLLVMFFLPVIGSIAYLFAGRKGGNPLEP